MTEQRTRLDVTRNPDVIATAAKALLEARKRVLRNGDDYVAEMLIDTYGMLFVDVADDEAEEPDWEIFFESPLEEQEREQEYLNAQAFVETFGWPGEVEG